MGTPEDLAGLGLPGHLKPGVHGGGEPAPVCAGWLAVARLAGVLPLRRVAGWRLGWV